MQIEDHDPITNRKWTRWDNVVQLVGYLSEALFMCDADGEIPVYLFDNHTKHSVASSRATLLRMLASTSPGGGTDLGVALKRAFSDLSSQMDHQTMLFIVVTDGETEQSSVMSAIRTNLPRRDPTGNRLNVLFLRVGDDPAAARFLKTLDDCREIGDWVDTKSDNAAYKLGPFNLFANAIYEHLDRVFPDLE